MSIAAMNWAWRQDVKPVPKLILMALADAADDEGVCWPSVSTVATKSGVSSRTVQRVMQSLTKRELLVAEPRHRGDGSCLSNRYRLLLQGGDNLSPAPDGSDTTPRHGCQGDPDRGVVPRTTIRTQKEPPLPPMPKSEQRDRGGGTFSDLIFPKDLLPTEQSQAQTMVGVLNAPIKRAKQGTFAPERALPIAQARKVKQCVANAQHTVPDLGPIDENNALAQRLMALSKQAKGKNR